MVSCHKEFDINFGFDSPIDSSSNGLVIAKISQNVEKIYLSGFINLAKGEVDVYLTNPEGIAVYSKTIVAPIELNISETFEAKTGYWKLKYISKGGAGKIDLHLFKHLK